RTFGIWVERVSGFEIRGNAFVHTPTGLGTRLASGVVEGNFCSAYGLGLLLLGGSINQPAPVIISAHRCLRQGEGGIILGGAAGLALLDLGANPLAVAPIQQAYDRSNHDDLHNLPDTLTALVSGNDISDNTHFGARLWGYPPSKYTTTDGILTS